MEHHHHTHPSQGVKAAASPSTPPPAAASASASANETQQRDSPSTGGGAVPLVASLHTPADASTVSHRSRRARRPSSPLLARSPAAAYLSLRRLLDEVERQQAHLSVADASLVQPDSNAGDGEDADVLHGAQPVHTAASSRIASVADAREASSSISSTPTAHKRRPSPSSVTAARALRRLSFLAQWTRQVLEAYPLVEDSDAECAASPPPSPIDDVFTGEARTEAGDDGGGVQKESAGTMETHRVLGAPPSLLTKDMLEGAAAAAPAPGSLCADRRLEAPVLSTLECDAAPVDKDKESGAVAADAAEHRWSAAGAHNVALLHLVALPSLAAAAAPSLPSSSTHGGDAGDVLRFSNVAGRGRDRARESTSDSTNTRLLSDHVDGMRRHAATASSSLGSPPPPPVVPRDRPPLRCDVGPAYDPPLTPVEQRAVLMAQGGACAHCGVALTLPRCGFVKACWAALFSCCCGCCCRCGSQSAEGEGEGEGGDEEDADERRGLLAGHHASPPPLQHCVTAAHTADITERDEARRSPTPVDVARRLRLTSSLSSATAVTTAPTAAAPQALDGVSPTPAVLSTAAPAATPAASDASMPLYCAFEGRFLCLRCFDAPLSYAAGQSHEEALEWQTRSLSPPHEDVGDSGQGVSPVRTAVSQAADRVQRWWEARHTAGEAAATSTAAGDASSHPAGPPHRPSLLLLPTQAQRTAAAAVVRARCVLPAHVLLRWDFTRYPVSASAAAVLRRLEAGAPAAGAGGTERRSSVMEANADATYAMAASLRTSSVLPALYDVSRVHPALYRAVPALAEASQLRKRLCLVHALAWWCPQYRAEVWGQHTPVSSRRFDSAGTCSVPRGMDMAMQQQQQHPAEDRRPAGGNEGDGAKESQGQSSSALQPPSAASPPHRPRCAPRRRYLVERAEGWSLLDLHRLTVYSQNSAAPRTLQLLAELQAMHGVLQEHVEACAACRMRRRATSEGQ